jgi:hypothetical protein
MYVTPVDVRPHDRKLFLDSSAMRIFLGSTAETACRQRHADRFVRAVSGLLCSDVYGAGLVNINTRAQLCPEPRARHARL